MRSLENSSAFKAGVSRADQVALGKSLREKCPRSAHAVWQPAADRPDPVALLEESSKGRIPQLIPIRYGRMLQSPFTFFRGAALKQESGNRPAVSARHN
jgi:hypothetical protein